MTKRLGIMVGNTAAVSKVWLLVHLCPWQFSFRKGPNCHRRTGVYTGTKHIVHADASILESLAAKGIGTILYLPYSWGKAPAGFFLFKERSRDWLACCCPRIASR
jgi:hypothetical protein